MRGQPQTPAYPQWKARDRAMTDEQQKQGDSREREVGPGKPPIEHQWQPGESGNPAGRPPNEGSITYWMKKLLAEPNGGGQPVARTIAKQVIAQAKKGNLKAAQEIADRTEGKPLQKIDAEVSEKRVLVD